MKRLFLMVFLLAPAAAAGSAESPELVDSAGDQTTHGLAPPLFGTGLDLRAVWFSDDESGLHATIQVEDLAGLIAEPGQVLADAMFIAVFELDHADKSGPGGRGGAWTLRGDYQAGNAEPWSYRGEGPCLDDDTDGCAGQDRAIIESLPGTFDMSNHSVTITLPWNHLGNVSHGDGVKRIQASTQFVYPTWPVYTVDWDTDQVETATYQYRTAGSGAAGTDRFVAGFDEMETANDTPALTVAVVALALVLFALRRRT